MTNSLLQINNAYPKDIYELYNDTLNNDQSYVDLIVDSINYAIYDIMHGDSFDPDINISPAGAYTFDYDTNEWIGDLDKLRRSRITDQVIKHFRANGIRCFVKNDLHLNYNVPLYLAGTFNSMEFNINILTIEWFIRQNNEYMKSYC